MSYLRVLFCVLKGKERKANLFNDSMNVCTSPFEMPDSFPAICIPGILLCPPRKWGFSVIHIIQAITFN